MPSEFYRRCFQIATAAILGYLLYRILHPLSGMLGWAAVLALILYPLQERLTRLFGGRRALSAALLTAITPFLVLAPLSVLTGAFVGQVTRLIEYLRGHSALSLAVVFGSAVTALIQGLFVGAGFALVGLPSPVVFGVLGTIAAFLPAGASAVLIPAVLYLAFGGRWGAAIFLACWTAALWIVENVLRPLLTAQQVEVSTLAIFVGAIGGAAAFGILGLVIGPVLLSFAVALVRFAQEN